MATIPPIDPQPDTGPANPVEPTAPPPEVAPMPGDVDVPDPS